MLKSKAFPVEKIYVPTKRRQTLDVEKVRQIAESMLKKGGSGHAHYGASGWRALVLVEELHRLEACRSLGEQTVLGYWCRPGSTDAPRCHLDPACVRPG